MSRLPKAAHFLTILSYLPGPDDHPPHYQGPLYAEADGDLADVLRDMRRCLEVLTIAYDLPAESVRLWLSGGRSVHLTIPASVMGAEDGHPSLPDLYKVMVDTLFPPTIAATLDRSIYNRGKGRMWRLPNRRRTDTGKYKVPISPSELLHKAPAELEAFTCKPRKGLFWPPEQDVSPCAGLVQLYQDVRQTIEAATVRRTLLPKFREGYEVDGSGVIFRAFQARGWIDKELSPGKWNVICPWASEHTKGEDFDTSVVLFAPRPGEDLGWWHCSHAHCEGRTIHEVLALFSEQELRQARMVRGFRTIAAAEVTAWRR